MVMPGMSNGLQSGRDAHQWPLVRAVHAEPDRHPLAVAEHVVEGGSATRKAAVIPW